MYCSRPALVFIEASFCLAHGSAPYPRSAPYPICALLSASGPQQYYDSIRDLSALSLWSVGSKHYFFLWSQSACRFAPGQCIRSLSYMVRDLSSDTGFNTEQVWIFIDICALHYEGDARTWG